MFGHPSNTFTLSQDETEDLYSVVQAILQSVEDKSEVAFDEAQAKVLMNLNNLLSDFVVEEDDGGEGEDYEPALGLADVEPDPSCVDVDTLSKTDEASIDFGPVS